LSEVKHEPRPWNGGGRNRRDGNDEPPGHEINENLIRILLPCHVDASLCDLFIERQKYPAIYTKGEQNEKDK
jgi:hypothetical protein